MRSILPLCLALAAPLTAMPAIAATAPAASIPAGRYVMDKDHRKLLWSVDHFGFSAYYGHFTGLDGTLMLDPAKPAASSVEVTIDINSISTDNATLQTELKSADWFDAAKFPTATFKSTKVVPGANGHAKVTGNLTLHGVTKPVTLDVTLHGAGMHPMMKVETVGFDAKTTINRSEFGITKFAPMISDKVDLTFSAEFHLAK
ncbi:MAG TPA: YceI family protein [Sphingomonadaceae bacterium]|nr:YceI family protein [Sphingomonadaceae bacterium]